MHFPATRMEFMFPQDGVGASAPALTSPDPHQTAVLREDPAETGCPSSASLPGTRHLADVGVSNTEQRNQLT